jgi:transcriptional regulator with XRE-family HTH domain
MPKRTGRPPGFATDGPKIRSLRVDLGLTATEVGAKVGCDAQTVRRAERGGPIDPVFASRIARVLGLAAKDIAAPPREVAALNTKKGPVAANDRADERITAHRVPKQTKG